LVVGNEVQKTAVYLPQLVPCLGRNMPLTIFEKLLGLQLVFIEARRSIMMLLLGSQAVLDAIFQELYRKRM